MNNDLLQIEKEIAQTRRDIERDEALAKFMLACAEKMRALTDALEASNEENKRLRKNQKIIKTYKVKGDLIQKQIIKKLKK